MSENLYQSVSGHSVRYIYHDRTSGNPSFSAALTFQSEKPASSSDYLSLTMTL